MSTPAQRQQRRSRIDSECGSALSQLAAIHATGVESHVGPGPLGQFASQEGTQACEVAAQMAQLGRQVLPEAKIELIGKAAARVRLLLDRMKAHSRSDHDGDIASHTLMQELQGACGEFLGETVPVLGTLILRGPGFERLEDNFMRPMRDALDAARKTQAEITALRNECNLIVTKARDRAGAIAVAHFTEDFDERIVESKRLAKRWLIGTILTAALTLIVAGAFLVMAFMIEIDSIAQGIQIAIAKLIAVSILSFMAVWCAKNYGAAKHNQLTYQHRSSSLRTFNAFTAAATEKETRDAILLLCADAAFGARSTGYDHSESTEPSQRFINPVVDLVSKYHQ